MRVPFLDLAAQTRALRAELDGAVARTLDEARFVGGGAVQEFEHAWAEFCGAKHAVGVASDTAALELALRAAGITQGDEVVAPANTCVPTIAAIEGAGATPVLVDADPETWTLDTEHVDDVLSERTRAVVPVHLYGRVAKLDPRDGLTVVEDAAQAHGAVGVGSIGIATAFSFYPTKNLGAVGDAGAIVTDDDGVAEHLRRLRNYGEDSRYHSVEAGTNSRLDTLQAAVLLAKLPQLPSWNERRRALAARYTEALEGLPIVLPAWDETGVWHLFVVRVQNREAFRAGLEARGVGTAVHYPRAVHEHPRYMRLAKDADFPVAEALAREVVSVPLHPFLSDADQEFVVKAIREWAA